MNENRTKIRTLVISLPTSTERRSRISANLDCNSSIEWRYFDAVGGNAATALRCDTTAQLQRYGRALTFGETGCFKSHYLVLDDFSKNCTEHWLLVLEDDLYIDPNFDFRTAVALADSHGIGYLRLFARRLVPFRNVSIMGPRQLVRFCSDPYGTQAYLINLASARNFVSSIEDISLPIDDELGRYWRHGLVPYALFPFPVVELSGASTLEGARESQSPSRKHASFQRLNFRAREKLQKTWINFRLRTTTPSR